MSAVASNSYLLFYLIIAVNDVDSVEVINIILLRLALGNLYICFGISSLNITS